MTTPAIQTFNLCKTYYSGFFRKKFSALDDLNFNMDSGEILGYLGPNGAGKTTTFKLLLGLIKPSSGHIEFFGNDIRETEYRHQIGYLTENPYFYPFLTGEESLRFHGNLHGLKARLLNERIESLMEQVGLGHAINRPLKKYSRGMLQRIGIAQALINDPKLLILDEPMSGLDPFGRKEMRDIILSCRDQGKTVIFSSHILSDVEMMCDRAAIILEGKLRDVFSVSDMLGRKINHWEVSTNDCSQILLDRYVEHGAEVVRTGKQILVKTSDEVLANRFMIALQEEGGRLLSFTPYRESLEDIFVKHTGKEEE